jgi:hypothetical protein
MIRGAATILLAAELGAGFGTAAATVVSTTDQSMVVDLHVGIETPADSVVAHFSIPGEETVVIPLLPRDGVTYGVTTELKLADYQVVFEAVGPEGAVSNAVRLSEMGVDTSFGEQPTATIDTGDERSPETRRWLWLGVALGAGSLSVLAFWALGGREDPDGDHVPDHTSPRAPGSDA